MNTALACMVVLLLAAGTYVSRFDADQLMRRFSKVKRTDRRVSPWLVLAVTAGLLTGEWVTFRVVALPDEIAWPLLALSAYVPLSFTFFCYLVNIGAQRELLWICWFFLLSVTSVMVFESLRVEIIIPLSLALGVWFCVVSLKDPHCHYRRGLRSLDEDGRPERAIVHLQRATEGARAEARYRYHLGRAHARAGQEDEGRRLMLDAMEERPSLLDDLKDDPLFREEWLEGLTCSGDSG